MAGETEREDNRESIGTARLSSISTADPQMQSVRPSGPYTNFMDQTQQLEYALERAITQAITFGTVESESELEALLIRGMSGGAASTETELESLLMDSIINAAIR